MAKRIKNKTHNSNVWEKLKTQLTNNKEGNSKYKYIKKEKIECILNGQIYIIKNFLNTEICKEIINLFNKELNLERTKAPKKDEATRVNYRISYNDLEIADILWKKLKQFLLPLNNNNSQDCKNQFFGALGLNDNIRVYKYCKGDFFDSHYDDSVECFIPIEYEYEYENENKNKIKLQKKIARTRWTLLIYLTGVDNGVKGGETIFYEEDNTNSNTISISPEIGMALLHKHGSDCLLHKGDVVVDGEKWVLRSDVAW